MTHAAGRPEPRIQILGGVVPPYGLGPCTHQAPARRNDIRRYCETDDLEGFRKVMAAIAEATRVDLKKGSTT